MQPLRPLAGGAALAAVLGMLACGCGRSEGDDSSTPATVASQPYSLTLLGRTPEEDRTVLVIHGVEEFGAENLRLRLQNGEWRPPRAESFTSADAQRRLLISQREPVPPDVLIEARTVDGTDLWLPCYEAVLPSLPPGAEPTQLDLRDLLRRAEWRFSTPWPDEEHRFEVQHCTRSADRTDGVHRATWSTSPGGEWAAGMSVPLDGRLTIAVELGMDSRSREYDLSRKPDLCEFHLPPGEILIERPTSVSDEPDPVVWRVIISSHAGPGRWVRTCERELGPQAWTRIRLISPGEHLLDLASSGDGEMNIARARLVHQEASRVRFTMPARSPRRYEFAPPPAESDAKFVHAALYDDLTRASIGLSGVVHHPDAPILLLVPEHAEFVRLSAGTYTCTAVRDRERDRFELMEPWCKLRPYLLGSRADGPFVPDWLVVLDEGGVPVDGGPLAQNGLGGLLLKVWLDPERRYRFVAYEDSAHREVLADAGAEPWIALNFAP